MKVVVLGGSGRMGRVLCPKLEQRGVQLVSAARATGVDTLSGVGLANALDRADVVIDALNFSSTEGDAERLFQRSTNNVVAAAHGAGTVRHLLVLSIVGTDSLEGSYFRGKQSQERTVAESGVPFTIARCTQFVEFLPAIADAHTIDGVVRLPPIQLQPIPIDDAAEQLARITLGRPMNGIVDITGRETLSLEAAVRRALAPDDPRPVTTDPHAKYFGSVVRSDSLTSAAGSGPRARGT